MKTWNVRLVGPPKSDWSGTWIGVVYADDENGARLAALATYDIPSEQDFEVSPR